MSDTRLTAQIILKLIRDWLDDRQFDLDTDLIEAGILDSSEFIQLLVRLEEAFGIRISATDLDIEKFRNVKQIAKLVHTKLESSKL